MSNRILNITLHLFIPVISLIAQNLLSVSFTKNDILKKIALIVLLPLLILHQQSRGEGTKEIIPPGSSGKGELLIGTNGVHTFATATSTADYRLHIHIMDYLTETINFGFGNASTGNPWYSVHRPDGTILCTGAIPKTPGMGYISTYAQAIAGPFPGSGGYTPIQCNPDVNGDHYVEIHNQHPSGTHLDYNGSFIYFDLTTINTVSGLAIIGRVWSKCWQFDCGSPNNYNDFFDGKVYVYSADSIVTSIDFIMTPAGTGDPLAFLPAEWDLMCNETGCYPIGGAMPFDEARRSVNTTAGYPQFRIFLNNPDSTVYPSGTFGSMIGTPTFLAHCDGTYDISVMATKAGLVEVYIEINPLDPIQNVTLRQNVLASPVINVITWDGLDGYGNPVPSGTSVTMHIKYLNGLTNFPITNVDINTNGFQISLERPSGSAPQMYWDDQFYFPTLGTTNLTGCQYSNPGDCHVWDWRAFGHDKTINTWWYVASTTAAPTSNLVERAPAKPDSIAGPDTVCHDWIRNYTLYPNPLEDADPNGYEWVLTDVATGLTDQTWSNADTTISIDFSSYSTGVKRLKVHGHNAPCGFGPFGPGEPPDGIQIMVESKPAITNTTDLTFCSQQTTNILITSTGPPSTTYSYITSGSSPNLSGFANGTLNPIVQTLINTGYTVGTVTYAIAGTNWLCPGDTTYLHVHVSPLPTDTISPDTFAICSEETITIPLVSTVTGTTFSWTSTGSSGNITGYSNGSGSQISQQLINSGYSIETVNYSIIPTANGCDGMPLLFTVTVFPLPDVSNAITSFTQCNGATTNIGLTSNVSGTTFAWVSTGSSGSVSGFYDGAGSLIAQTLTNAGYAIESVTYQVTPLANGCPGIPVDFSVTVYPTPDVSNTTTTFAQCDGATTAIGLTSNVTGTTYTWTVSVSSGNLAGFAGGSGSLIAQTLTNSGYTIETVTYQVTPSANGCTGVPVDFTVTVYPTPDVSNTTTSFTQCSGATTSVTLTSNISGTSFSWMASGSSAYVSGYTGGTGSLIAQALSNSGFAIETVTYLVIPSVNGCTGTPVPFTVTVYPIPDINNSITSFTQCNTETTNISLSSNVSGAIFTWIASGSSANITGYTSGTGTPISQTLVNSGNTTENVVYTVTPIANGCLGTSVIFTVSVYPTADVTTPNGGSICTQATTNILLASNVSGTTYSWVASGSSPFVSGYSDGNGNQIAQQLYNSGFVTEEVKYLVTPWFLTCLGNPETLTTEVLPAPDLFITPATEEFCTGGSTSFSLSSSVPTTLFNWTPVSSSPQVSGFAAGNGNLIQQTLINTAYTTETVTYLIIPVASGCIGEDQTVVVTVNPLPYMQFSLCDQFNLTVSSKPVILKGGLPLQGSYTGPGVSGNQFFPALAGPGTHTITYTYTNMHGCSDSRTQSQTVIADVPHTCGTPVIDPRDGSSYPTVQIGSRCWMAINLNFGSYIFSTAMQRDNCVPEKYCLDNITSNCTSLGGLYQWDEVMNYSTTSEERGLCMPGWHIPSENEWNALFALSYNNAFAGDSLKPGGISGFDADLNGVRFNNVLYEFHNWAVMFWSSSMHGPFKAWAHGMNTYNHSVSYYPSHRNNSFPVRCLKD